MNVIKASQEYANAISTCHNCRHLRAEIVRLQEIIEGLTERVAKQSNQLSMNAEKQHADQATPAARHPSPPATATDDVPAPPGPP